MPENRVVRLLGLVVVPLVGSLVLTTTVQLRLMIWLGAIAMWIALHAADELVGTDLRALLHPEDRRRVFGTILDAVASGQESVTVDCRVLHADGQWRHAEAAVSSMLDDDEVRGVILNTRDISERRALQD